MKSLANGSKDLRRLSHTVEIVAVFFVICGRPQTGGFIRLLECSYHFAGEQTTPKRERGKNVFCPEIRPPLSAKGSGEFPERNRTVFCGFVPLGRAVPGVQESSCFIERPRQASHTPSNPPADNPILHTGGR